MASIAKASNKAIESSALLNQAQVFLGKGELQASEDAFNKVVALSIDAHLGFYGIGVVQFKRGDLTAASISFQKCLQLDPENANAYYFLGEIEEKRNLHDQAVPFFKKALAISPDHFGAQQRLRTPAEVAADEKAARDRRVYELGHERHDQTGHPVEAQAGHASNQGDPTNVYAYVPNDQSALAKEVFRLTNSLTLVSVKPRLSAYYGQIARNVLVGLLFVPFLIISLGPVMGIGLVLVPLGMAVSSFVLFIRVPFLILGIKCTKITLDKGRVEILKGVIRKSQQNIELYRVEDIELHQTLINQITRDGTILLHVTPGHAQAQRVEVKLTGLAKIDQLRVLFEQLRNLVLLMRTGSWGKGIIY